MYYILISVALDVSATVALIVNVSKAVAVAVSVTLLIAASILELRSCRDTICILN